jgi:excisionase family DNA binding protein
MHYLTLSATLFEIGRAYGQAGAKVFSRGAAAHELGLHPMTVRRWIKIGRIHAVQVDREIRIPRAEIERLVSAQGSSVRSAS